MTDDRRWVEDELVRLVGIFSPSGEEAEIVEYVMDRLGDEGASPWRIPTPGGHDNVVAGSRRPLLVVTAHLDTIRPSWPWSGEATIDEDVVYGLGAVDDKGGVAAAMLALVSARSAGIDLDDVGVAFVFTVDEEVNGTGSLAAAAALEPRYTVALEGTGLSPGIAEAGVVAGSAEVKGRSIHGSLPEYGDNAIVKAARLILDLEEAQFTRVTHRLLGPALPCVEMIRGGSDLYAVPDTATLRFDIRVVPGIAAADVVEEVRALCRRRDASLEVEEAVDAFSVDEASPLVAALQASSRRVLGADRPVCGVAAWTDAHNFDAVGSEAVVFGPGRLVGSAHQPDEHVPVDEVVVAGRVIADLLERGVGGLAG